MLRKDLFQNNLQLLFLFSPLQNEHIFFSISILSLSVWGWDGKGTSSSKLSSSTKKRDPSKPFTIIVSRSHAGKVKEVARAAFGPKTEVLPAGGAGEIVFLLKDILIIIIIIIRIK